MTTRTGIIYKLCCKNPEITDTYVGSTINFHRRKHHHKQRCNDEKTNGHNAYVYQFIRSNGGFSNWDMIELTKVQFSDRNELRLKERELLDQTKATLNQRVPSRTKKQYYDENICEILKRKKKYYCDNYDECYEKRRVYSQQHRQEINKKARERVVCKICGGQYARSNKYSHIRSKKHLQAEIY